MATIFAPHQVNKSSAHYAEVREEMRKLGAPTIRAAWCETHGAWAAIEGSHRLAAAQELGLVDDVTIVDVTESAEIEHDLQDYESPCAIAALGDWLLDTRRLNATLMLEADVARGRASIEQYITSEE